MIYNNQGKMIILKNNDIYSNSNELNDDYNSINRKINESKIKYVNSNHFNYNTDNQGKGYFKYN